MGIDNILILNISLAFGEFIITTGAIREIRMNYPYANITMITSLITRSIAECCPYVNEILYVDNRSIEKKNILENLKFISDFAKEYLWKKYFVVCLNLRYNYLRAFSSTLAYISGASERVSIITSPGDNIDKALQLEKNPGNIFLTHPILHSKKIIHFHSHVLYTLADFGLNVHDTELELWYSIADSRKAEKLLNGFAPNSFKIIVGINAANPLRKYPAKKYLPALKEIIDKGASIIIFGGPAEAEDAKFLQKNLPEEFVMNLTEILPGRRVEAAILSEHADMYLGNMTGSADMAAAAHLPCVLLTAKSSYGEKMQYYCAPWQTNFIFVTPKNYYKNLKSAIETEFDRETATIDKIEPEEIVAAYDEMIHFLKYSGIRKTTCPPIIRNIDAMKKLSGLFDRV